MLRGGRLPRWPDRRPWKGQVWLRRAGGSARKRVQARVGFWDHGNAAKQQLLLLLLVRARLRAVAGCMAPFIHGPALDIVWCAAVYVPLRAGHGAP